MLEPFLPCSCVLHYQSVSWLNILCLNHWTFASDENNCYQSIHHSWAYAMFFALLSLLCWCFCCVVVRLVNLLCYKCFFNFAEVTAVGNVLCQGVQICTFHDGCKQGIDQQNFLKICWSIPCLHPSWKVHTWIEICASLNHCKKMKADGSRLIPWKHTETLVLLGVQIVFFFVETCSSVNVLFDPLQTNLITNAW